jgi:membrane associated rhomboid family serine protease
MSTLWKDIQYKMLHSGSKLNLLIGINIIVYLLINILAVLLKFFFGSDAILYFNDHYLQLPAYLPTLLKHFWTPLTYMFLHDGIFHILFNMLWLYWIGQIFEEYLGKNRTLGLYLIGGFAGAFFFVAAYNLFPFYTQNHLAESSILAGASASVMTIIVATATLLPDYTIPLILIGPVKLKWLAVFFVVIDFLGITGMNAGGELSHLGGALMGFIYIRRLQGGHDMITGIANLFKPKPKLKVVSKNPTRSRNDLPRQEEIDMILDKISKSGYDSLTKQEKEILFRASNNEG